MTNASGGVTELPNGMTEGEECPQCGEPAATYSANGKWYACGECGGYSVPR